MGKFSISKPPEAQKAVQVDGLKSSVEISPREHQELQPADIQISAFDVEALDGRREMLAEFESNARLTVIRMLTEAPTLDKEFSFKVVRFGGDAYVQAMRMVLTRSRNAARNEKMKLTPFKLLVISIQHEPTHDLVTVVRSNRGSAQQKRAYDDIIASLAAEKDV